MKNRSVATVVILSLITFGIYVLVWMVKTKNEMNRQGASIPTAWMMLIPLVGPILWMWKYCAGVELVTRGKFNQGIAFVMLYLLNLVGIAILQDAFNKAAGEALPEARAVS